MSRRRAFNRWHYSDPDPEGLGLLEEFRRSEDWSAPERLWMGVLLKAKQEATYEGYKWGWCRDYARRWIFHGGRDFELVCWWAGVLPEDFRHEVRREIGE